MIRTVKRKVTGIKTEDGAGVKLTRVISKPDVYDFDPFLMLDAFDSENPEDYVKGFPWHPHRGIETVTYLINGIIDHGDSLGNSGRIIDGSCQWMTAGGGILHQEMPRASQRMLGVQLWLNLSSKDKMVSPKYRDITSESVYEITDEGCMVRIISGIYNGVESAIKPDYIKANFFDVILDKSKTWNFSLPKNDTLFIYCIEGEITCASDLEVIYKKEAALFTEGSEVSIKSNNGQSRFLVFSGSPIKEPIAWGGPIVMNTREELNKAYEDLENGTFINKKKL